VAALQIAKTRQDYLDSETQQLKNAGLTDSIAIQQAKALWEQRVNSNANQFLIEHYQQNHFQQMLKSNPRLNELLNNIMTDFAHNITLCLQRFFEIDGSKDYKTLTQVLLDRTDITGLQINEIKFSDGDLHNQGQQVLLLLFAERNAPEKIVGKIVYKPTNVMADAQLVGNTQKLQSLYSNETWEENFGAGSIVEKINQYLPNDAAIPPLLTYIIYSVNWHCKDAYGFIQYLPHEPWPEIDYEQEFYEILSSMTPQQRRNPSDVLAKTNQYLQQHHSEVQLEGEYFSVDQILSDYADKRFELALLQAYQAMSNKENSFIIGEQQAETAIKRYSQHCGLLAAICRCFGISDMHIQNFISPYLIDLEVSFQPEIKSFEKIGLFDSEVGAMHQNSAYKTSIELLLDGEGQIKIGYQKVEKNRIYHLMNNELISVSLDKERFIQGFRTAFNIFCNQKAIFQTWLQRPVIQHLRVRVLPVATQELIELQNNIFNLIYENNSDADSIIQQIYAQQKNDMIIVLFKEINLSTEPHTISPRFAAINPEYMRPETQHQSLPIYYRRLNESDITTGDDEQISVDWNEVQSAFDEGKEHHTRIKTILSQRSSHYYEESAEKYFVRYFTVLNQSAINDLINNFLTESVFKDLPENQLEGDEVVPSSCPSCRIL